MLSLESTSSRMSNLARQEIYFDRQFGLDETLQGVERVTSADVPDLESVDEPLPYEEVRRLTARLPEKERAAVFLRYGYDLSYEDIGTALGSSSEAARQAASSGVRRLRKKELS